MKNLLLLMLTTSLISSVTTALDVLPKNRIDSHFIKVTVTGAEGNQEVAFDLCDKTTNGCQQIGKQRSYNVNALASKSTGEYVKVGAKGIGYGIPIVAIGFAGGGWIAGAFFGAESVGEFTAGVVVGVGTTSYVASKIKYVNPGYNWHRARALRDDVIKGTDVRTSDVLGFASYLNEALDN